MVFERAGLKAFVSVILLVVCCMCVNAGSQDDIAFSVKKEIIRRNPDYKDSRIEVEFKTSSDLFESLDKGGAKLFKLDFPENRRLAGNLVLPVKVYEGSRFLQKVDVRSSVKIYKKILASAARIAKGTVMTGKEIRMIEKDISVLPSSVIFEEGSVTGKETMTFIPEGTVLLEWMFRPVPAVRKGETVDIFSASSGVTVRVKGVVLEDGYSGKVVKVRNISSERTVEGIVRSSSEVEAL